MENTVEAKRNQLNLEIRNLLAIIDFINDDENEYSDYVEGSLDEEEFLDQQLELVKKAKEKIVSIFKD